MRRGARGARRSSTTRSSSQGAHEKGEALRNDARGARARSFPQVCEGERGDGLLRGLVLKPGFVARDILPKILQNGVLLTAAGERVLRFSPPLVVTIAELDEGVAAVRKVLAQMDDAKKPTTAAATP